VEAMPESAMEPEVRFWVAGALSRSNRQEQALAMLSDLAVDENFGRREESILKAVPLLVSADKLAEAEQLLSLIPPSSPLHLYAGLEQAALSLEKGQPQAAEEILKEMTEVPPAHQSRHNYLLARARHDQADYEGALLVLGGTHQRGDVPQTEEVALLRAVSLARLGQDAEAIAGLESFLQQARGAASRSGAFSLLEKLLLRQASPSLGELRRLAADPAEPTRAREAALTLAHVEMELGRPAAAREHLEKLLSNEYADDLQRRASMLLARLELRENQPGIALQLIDSIPQADPEAAFWRGCALLELQRYEEAVRAFWDATAEPALRVEAAFNGLLAWELEGEISEEPGFAGLLAAGDPDGLLQRELRLQVALEKARNGDREAAGRLRDLAPALGSEAAVPLAEWFFVNNQPADAARVLEDSGTGSGAGQQEARAFLEIFLADSPDRNEAVHAAELARSFLRIFPDSQRIPEVKLKLGEISQRDGDYLSAYDFFSEVAEAAPDPQTAAHSWFLAGKAAARLMDADALERAILAFEEAAQGGGEIAARARYEQALLFNARGDSGEAVVLLDRVAADTTDPGLRAAALIEKGDSFHSLGAEDPEMFRKAIEAWHPLVGDSGIAAPWRDQALTKTGLARMRLGEPDMALENFYNVLLGERESPGGVWFDRAGFEAARLLEERKAWAEAIRLYQILSDAGGPRAEEAATRANRVRLENFLWEG